MTSETRNNVSRDIPALVWMNFFSTLNPVLWCSLTAREMQEIFPHAFKLNAGFVLLVSGLFVLPMLFTSGISNYMMSKLPCRNILSSAKIIEMMTALLLLVLRPFMSSQVQLAALLITTLLLGLEYAIYRPSLRCYMALLLPKRELSNAVGKIQCAAFAGAAAGMAIAVFGNEGSIHYGVGRSWGLILFFAFAAYALVMAARVRVAGALRPQARFAILRHLRRAKWDKQPLRFEIGICFAGELFVLSLLVFMISIVSQYARVQFFDSWLRTDFALTLLLLSTLIGASVGCRVGGILSRDRVEIGLLPVAATLTVLLLIGLGCLPELQAGLSEYNLLIGGLFVFGFNIGVMMVPLQAFGEYFVKKELCPAYFAKFYTFFGGWMLGGILISAGALALKIEIWTAALTLAGITGLMMIFAYRKMPQMLLRAGMLFLLKTIYRLRIFHAENLPESGPALLVANRSSFVDIFFITAATSRPVRFLVHESYFRYPFLQSWYKAAGFLEVPNNKPRKLRKFFKQTQELLRKGEIICIFPEEDITRNGVMRGFRDGMQAMLPPDIDVPVIPVRIGMTWGSIFSCYYGKFKLRLPNELPHPASVTIGSPIPPDTSAYEIRIILSELAAKTETLPEINERPFHSQFAFLAKHHPCSAFIRELDNGKWRVQPHLKLLSSTILISRYLRRHRRNGGEYIGVMLPNSIALFKALTAVMMADRIPAVLNYTASAEAREYAVAKAGLKTIITSRALLEKCKISPAPGMIFIEDLEKKSSSFWANFWWKSLTMILPNAELMKLVSPDSWDDVNKCAVVLFSSGSTGIPKGVMLSHHNIYCNVQAFSQSIGWTGKDRVAGNLPLFHSFGLTVCLWMPMYSGAEVAMIPNPLDAAGVGTAMRERKATVLFATPSFLQLYMRRCGREDFENLRLVIAGAEKLRDDIADKFREMTGLVIAEAYGCTELSPVVSVNLANSLMELGVEVAKYGSIGPPIPGVCVKIVDPSTFDLLPENTDGLLIVKGAIVMLGYLDDPEKTIEVIRDGWYITGDIARMDRNGFMTITGRLSRFSKIAGEMVPHELVEREINNILQPDRRIVAVTGAPDKDKGEKLIVFYTDSELLAPEQIIRIFRDNKIPNLWIPKAENFIKVDELPMLGSGKLDLSQLNRMAAQLDRVAG